MTAILALFEGMRPRQWVKNFLLLFGVVFARQAGNPDSLLLAFQGFAVFCLLSGSVYLFNDRLDLEQDRCHPKKCHRPMASGRLGEGLFRAAFPVFVLLALVWSWSLGKNFFLLALAFFLLNLLYSTWMKHQVVLDVFGIAMNFVMRAVAGVAVLAPQMVAGFEGSGVSDSGSVFLSPWLLVTTFFGALFLAFAKRRSELLHLEKPESHRRVLKNYTAPLLDQLLSISAAAVLLSYALYTLWPQPVEHLGQDILLSAFFVTYGVMRYFYLIYRRDLGGDPSEVFLRDRPLQFGILLYVLSVLYSVGT
jgi:4-hydroxybenzoate polyprenyltransferase